jgi:NAD(P)H-hydrate epimerase
VWRWLVPPAIDQHKYDAGSLVVAGGAPSMSGAVTLACHGALRGGAGLVEALVPAPEHAVIDAQAVETLVHRGAVNSSGGLGHDAAVQLEALAERRDALVVGCGLGRDPELLEWLPPWIDDFAGPMVIDADALFAIAHADLRPRLSEYDILTPHGGEFERLTGKSPETVAEDRPAHLREAATEWGAVVLHKGAPTFVAAPDGRLAVIGAGGPGLATAGSGDVLAGLCGAFLAAGHEGFVAACLGAWVHGAAGDRVEALRGVRGTVASDLPAAAALVLRELESLPR